MGKEGREKHVQKQALKLNKMSERNSTENPLLQKLRFGLKVIAEDRHSLRQDPWGTCCGG
jgi:hypothetical protein